MQKKNLLVKKPDKQRRSFQIVPYTWTNGKRLYEKPIEHESLSSLNERYKSGELPLEEASLYVNRILLPALKKDFRIPEAQLVNVVICDGNLRIFNSFWAAHYRRKKIESPETARSHFNFALRMLEPLSLHAHIDDIQRHWDDRLKGTRHKRYGARLNQLLKFIGRAERLSLDKRNPPETRWVTWDELQKINVRVADPVLRDLYSALWATGCRLGELFAIKKEEVRADFSFIVERQLAYNRKPKAYTKNRRKHKTIVLPQGHEAFARWLDVEDKLKYRKRASHPLIYASREVFPSDPAKWMSPHKLRHSFVHFLVEKGVSLHRIKDLIGDTLKTTEETYAGWVIADESLEEVFKKLR